MRRFTWSSILIMLLVPLSLSAQEGASKGAFSHIKPYGNLYMFLGANYAEKYDLSENKENDSDLLYRINDNKLFNEQFNFIHLV